MVTKSFLEHQHELDGCYRDRIQELKEYCDHEYYMSALPATTTKKRAERGYARILAAVEEFKQLIEAIKCTSCHDEVSNQIQLQEKVLQEIKATWNF